jgi:transposase
MQTTRDRWAKRVRQWDQSGLTAAAFAAEWDLNPRTLAYWKWRLRKEAAEAPVAKEAESPPKFVEVTPAPSTWWQPADRIEIVISDRVVVRVPDAFDAVTLRRVIEALTGAAEDAA